MLASNRVLNIDLLLHTCRCRAAATRISHRRHYFCNFFFILFYYCVSIRQHQQSHSMWFDEFFANDGQLRVLWKEKLLHFHHLVIWSESKIDAIICDLRKCDVIPLLCSNRAHTHTIYMLLLASIRFVFGYVKIYWLNFWICYYGYMVMVISLFAKQNAYVCNWIRAAVSSKTVRHLNSLTIDKSKDIIDCVLSYVRIKK